MKIFATLVLSLCLMAPVASFAQAPDASAPAATKSTKTTSTTTTKAKKCDPKKSKPCGKACIPLARTCHKS